jgi:hypothetical protein
LTALAESADAQAAGKHSNRSGDESTVYSTFVLTDKLPNGSPIRPIKTETNTIIFKQAIQDFIKASFKTLAEVSPVVFNPKGLPVDLAACDESRKITYDREDKIYKDGSDNRIDFKFNAQGKVTSPGCAKTVESFKRFRNANLKVQLIENDPNSIDDDEIKYSIVIKTKNRKVVNELGSLSLSSENVDRDKVINDLSYFLKSESLGQIYIYNAESDSVVRFEGSF